MHGTRGTGGAGGGGGEGGLLVFLFLCALAVVFLVTRGGTWRRGGREEMEGG